MIRALVVDSHDYTNIIGCIVNLYGNIYELSPLKINPSIEQPYTVNFVDKYGTN